MKMEITVSLRSAHITHMYSRNNPFCIYIYIYYDNNMCILYNIVLFFFPSLFSSFFRVSIRTRTHANSSPCIQTVVFYVTAYIRGTRDLLVLQWLYFNFLFFGKILAGDESAQKSSSSPYL